MCELNLWGIETTWLQSCLQEFQCVWIEPVRDWNFISKARRLMTAKCVNWTCEGLKHFLNLIRTSIGYVCELNLWGIETLANIGAMFDINPVWIEPVRDWNSFPVLKYFSPKAVWIEPVRDWNSFPALMTFILLLRVNWTCEGLKQPLSWIKRRQAYMCELNLWGIETYNKFNLKNQAYLVWIEPVRDWNLTLSNK